MPAQAASRISSLHLASTFGILIAGGGNALAASCADLFLIHSERSTVIGSEAVVSGGWVSSNSFVELGAKSTLTGDLISGGDAVLGYKSKVEGNAMLQGALTRRHGAVITGSVAESTVVPECRIQEKTGIQTGRHDVTIHKHRPDTLNPGNYSHVKVLPFGKLTLKSGVYNFKSLDLGAKARLMVESGGAEVNVTRHLRFGVFSAVSAAGSIDFRAVNFYAQQGHDVVLGRGAKFYGVLTAPHAKIHALENAEAQGALYGKRVSVGHKCRLQRPAPPSVPPVQIAFPDEGVQPNRLPTVHEVPFDQATRLELIPGDLIRLVGFPTDTVYNQVDVDIGRAQTDTMKLELSEAGKSYPVTGIDADISFPYRGDSIQEIVVMSGFDTVDLDWGVSTAPRDTANPFAPPIHDLGPAGSSTILTISEGIFKISRYPSTPFNVITLRVESQDGDTLEGYLNAGGGSIALGGMSRSLMFKERGNITLVFDLSFPVRRRIAVTWNGENRTPAQRAVPLAVTTDSAGIHAVYRFTQDHMVESDLVLTFPSDAFTDGQAPTIARLEHNPIGVSYPYRPKTHQGPAYAINGNLAAGKSIQLALPIPERSLLRGTVHPESLFFMRYSSGVWTRIPPDSVSGGYVYFTTDAFSWGWVEDAWDWTTDAVGSAVDWVAEVGGDILVGLAEIVDGLADVLSDAYDFLVDGVCSLLDPGTYINFVINTSQPSAWSVPQGNLAPVIASPYFTANMAPLRQKVWGAPGIPATTLVNCIVSNEDTEWRCWDVYKANAELLLADVILSRVTGYSRRFFIIDLSKPSGYTGVWNPAMVTGYPNHWIVDTQPRSGRIYFSNDIFRFSSTMLASTPTIVSVLRKCNAITTPVDEYRKTWDRVMGFFGEMVDAFSPGGPNSLVPACKELLHVPADLVDAVLSTWGVDQLLCPAAAAAAINDIPLDYWQSPHRDGHIIGPSHFFNVFTMLLWADDQYKNTFRNHAGQLRDEIHGFTGFTHDFYENGNIPINSQAGVAFWDWLSKGDKTAFNTMKSWLENKMGPSGGYAEGTGYLQGEINAEIPYILAAMLRAGAISRSELPPKYLQSGNWLMNSSRFLPLPGFNLEILPAEVDDGGSYRTDFLSYSFLSEDTKFSLFQYGRGASGVSTPNSNSLRYFAFPATFPTGTFPGLSNVNFADGVGTVRAALPNDGPVATLTIVAESGDLMQKGFGHDQQDNSSITLDHSILGRIIVDPGYNGFGNRSRAADNFARFSAHNVVMQPTLPFGGEEPNPQLTLGYALFKLSRQPGLTQPDAIALICGILRTPGIPGSCSVPPIDVLAGGGPADLTIPLIQNSALLPSYGMEVRHTSTSGISNHRTALYFAEHMWVIDRPEQKVELLSAFNWFAPGPTDPSTGNPISESPYYALAAKSVANEVSKLPFSFPQQSGAIPVTRSVRKWPILAYVTGYPVAGGASDFTSIPVEGGAYLQRTTATFEERLTAPSWGSPFTSADPNIPGLSGKIILARRPVASTTWTVRLVGEESYFGGGVAVSARTMVAAPTTPYEFYEIRGNGDVFAILPDGSRQFISHGEPWK